MLADDWFEILASESVTSFQFSAAVKAVKRKCGFFPKVSDVFKAVQEYRENPPAIEYRQAQLADTTSQHDLTPEEVEKNLARLKHINRMLSKEISMEEAIGAVERESHIKEFRR